MRCRLTLALFAVAGCVVPASAAEETPEEEPAADEEAEVVIFEPSEVINTGDAPASDFTAPQGAEI